MKTIKLTTEQFELIQTAIEYWAQDQEMFFEDGVLDQEEWEQTEKILNDENFPF
jgi:DNA-binding MarR family transcriptional regulator